MAIHFERASDGIDVYNVDDVARTCTCPDFKFRAQKQGRECKHLEWHPTPKEEATASGPGFTVSTGGNASFARDALKVGPEESRKVYVYVPDDGPEPEDDGVVRKFVVAVRNNPKALTAFVEDVLSRAGDVEVSLTFTTEGITIY
jgi:hypothetical protein